MADLFQSSQPIYLQLAERIKKQIVRGEISPGDKLPSVRETGIQVNVNPNTVQRTYRELEAMNIVESRRGQGTFVKDDEEVRKKIREEMTERIINDFTRQMFEMGYSEEETKQGLINYFTQKGEENR